jgi:hypothetical protein
MIFLFNTNILLYTASPSWASSPRLISFGKIDVRLANLYQGYTKQNPPFRRVKPIPLPLLHEVYHVALLAGNILTLASPDKGYIGFYYLLRPGAYCSSSESTPFRLCEFQLRIGNIIINLTTCAFDTLDRTICAQLDLNDQRTWFVVKSLRTDAVAAPSLTLLPPSFDAPRNHRSHGATPLTPLYHIYTPTTERKTSLLALLLLPPA